MLAGLYAQSSGKIVFIDESYRSPKQALGGSSSSYYILTAVLVGRDKLATIRAKLRELAGVEIWHTTDQARTETGRGIILGMCRYLARTSISVVAVRAPINPKDTDAEFARAACMKALLRGLCDNGWLEESGLVVLERRRDSSQQAVDATTINALRRGNVIHQGLFVHQGSPATESMLWAPDIVAWATRRMLAMNEGGYVEPLHNANRFVMLRV